MRNATIDEMQQVTGGKTYTATWSCKYCAAKGKATGTSKSIARAKADLALANHNWNRHNV